MGVGRFGARVLVVFFNYALAFEMKKNNMKLGQADANMCELHEAISSKNRQVEQLAAALERLYDIERETRMTIQKLSNENRQLRQVLGNVSDNVKTVAEHSARCVNYLNEIIK